MTHQGRETRLRWAGTPHTFAKTPRYPTVPVRCISLINQRTQRSQRFLRKHTPIGENTHTHFLHTPNFLMYLYIYIVGYVGYRCKLVFFPGEISPQSYPTVVPHVFWVVGGCHAG